MRSIENKENPLKIRSYEKIWVPIIADNSDWHYIDWMEAIFWVKKLIREIH